MKEHFDLVDGAFEHDWHDLRPVTKATWKDYLNDILYIAFGVTVLAGAMYIILWGTALIQYVQTH